MRTNPIAGNAQSAPLAAPTTALSKAAASPEAANWQAKHDSVQLTALAKSLKSVGDTPNEIAQRMNLDIKTVYSYLGTAGTAQPTAATALANTAATGKAESVPGGAASNSVKADGLHPTALAKYLKFSGKTPAEIARIMNVDLKAVYLYLGISSKAAA
jgi:DNA-binding CsgD family transcriptional regulator